MKLAFAVLMVLSFTITSSAQYVPVYPVVGTRFALPGYSVPGLFNSASNIGTANPASLSEFTSLSAGLSYKFASQVREVYLYGDHGSRINTPLPDNAGIVYPVGNFRVGLALNQKYNLSVESAPIKVTTVEQPDGTGETFTAENERNVYDYSLLSSFMFNNVIFDNKFSLGLKLTLSRLDFRDALWKMEAKTAAYGFGFAAGIDYRILLSNEYSVNLGISFDKGVEYEKKFSVPSPQLSLVHVGENLPVESVEYLLDYQYMLTGNSPDVLKFDLTLDVIPHIKLYESFSNVYWHGVSAGYRNQIEFNSRVSYLPNDIFTYSIGVFSTDRKSVYSWINLDNSAIYLSAGISANIADYKLGIAFSDSHLFSSETRKQTIAEILLGYNFN